METNGVYFILSTKSEVVLPKNKESNRTFFNAMAEMQYNLFNMTLDFYKHNPELYNDTEGYIENHIKKLENIKIIINNKFALE